MTPAKKIKGKKRHILVDTEGLLLFCNSACGRYSGPRWRHFIDGRLLKFLIHDLLKLYADGGYQGPKFPQALKKIRRKIEIEIVKRSDICQGLFVALPRPLGGGAGRSLG